MDDMEVPIKPPEGFYTHHRPFVPTKVVYSKSDNQKDREELLKLLVVSKSKNVTDMAGERIKKGDAVYFGKNGKLYRCKKLKWYQSKLFFKIFKNKYRK